MARVVLFSEGVTLDDARSRLRAAPLADFVRTRAAIADELRARGEPHLAKLIATEKKPTRIAWALERVEAEPKRELERARDRARAAQEHASGDALRAALAEYRRALTRVADAAKDAMREAGMPVSASQERALRAALEERPADPLEALPKTLRAPKAKANPAAERRRREREKHEKKARAELARKQLAAERASAELAAARAKLEAMLGR